MVVAAPKSCCDMQLVSQQTPRSDDDNDSSFRFSMVHRSVLPTTSTTVVSSDGIGDYSNKGDGGEYGIH
jgi:hypothetical protein